MYNDNNMMGNSFESNSFESFGAPVPGYTSVPSAPAKKNNNKIPLLILIGVIAVMACGFIAAGLIYLNQPKVKVTRAVAKTMKDGGYLSEDLKSKLVYTKAMTYKFDIAYRGEDGRETSSNVEFAINGRDKQLRGVISVPQLGGYDFIADLNAYDFRFRIPQLDDHVFFYRYREKNVGMIPKALGSEVISELNSSLAKLYNTVLVKGSPDEELEDAVKNFYDRLIFRKAAASEFEVDGANCICKGYDIVITKDNMVSFLRDIKKYYDENYVEGVNDLSPSGNGFTGDFDNAMEMMEGIDEIVLHTYLSGGKLAAVQVSPSDSDYNISVLFKGGDYRLQNIDVTVDADGTSVDFMKVEGSRSDQKDSWKLNIAGEEVCTASYDHDSGKYDMEIQGDGYDYSVYGTYRSSREENAVLMNVKDNQKETTLDCKVYLYRGAEIKEVSGNEFDIGNASQDQILKLDLFKNLYKKLR